LKIEKIPANYKTEGAEIRQLTQKTTYELILRELKTRRNINTRKNRRNL